MSPIRIGFRKEDYFPEWRHHHTNANGYTIRSPCTTMP